MRAARDEADRTTDAHVLQNALAEGLLRVELPPLADLPGAPRAALRVRGSPDIA
jgi:hypothetical protein